MTEPAKPEPTWRRLLRDVRTWIVVLAASQLAVCHRTSQISDQARDAETRALNAESRAVHAINVANQLSTQVETLKRRVR